MMKRALCLLFLVFLLGCGYVTTSPFGERSFILIPTSQEVLMGRQAAFQVDLHSRLCADPVINNYVNEIGQRVASVCDRHDITYHFKVIDSKELNAFALPGGYVYIYTGLLKHLKNEAQLAFVLGHEVGHIVGRHAIRRLQLVYGIDMLLSLNFKGKELSQTESEVLNLLYNIVLNGYSRQDEYKADAMGTYYMAKAGWNPTASIQTIRILDSLMKFKPRGVDELFMDHPTNSKRIERLEHLIDRFPRTWLNNPFNEEGYRKNILNRLSKRSRSFLPALV